MTIGFKQEWLRGLRLVCIIAVWDYLLKLVGATYAWLGLPSGEVHGWIGGVAFAVLFVLVCAFGPVLVYRFARFFGIEIHELWRRRKHLGVDQARELHRS